MRSEPTLMQDPADPSPLFLSVPSAGATAGGAGMRWLPGLLALLALALPAPASAGALEEPADASREARTVVRGTFEAGGLARSYALYVPDRLAAEPALVLVLHGSGGDADRIRGFTDRRFERLADRHGFAVAYPEGFEGNWNGCRKRAPFSANRRGVDDPAFLRALVDRVREEHGAGAGGVLAFGFSGGGHLAFRLALEAPGLADALVAVGANLPDPGDSDCAPKGRPVPVLMITGTEDPINPYRGGDVVLPEALGGATLGRVLSAEATASHFAGLAGHREAANPIQDPDRDGDPATAVERRTWAGAGPGVSLITLRGAGHTIPRRPPGGTPFPAFVGPDSTELDAVQEAWTFFERHRADPTADREAATPEPATP